MKAVISTPLLLAAAIALSACAVGPDYRAPDVAPAHIERAAATGFDQSRFQAAWWRQFDDLTLDALVGEALSENLSLIHI